MAVPFLLLINPWIYDFAAYDLWIRPVGLLSIAAALKKSGCGVHLLDCLDSHHPAMQNAEGASKLQHKPTGQGRFFKQHIPKPEPLSAIPRNYSRYGMYPDIFRRELAQLPRPDAVLVGSMMTYWYPGVIDCIGLVKEAYPGVPVLLGGVYASLCPGHAMACTGADRVLQGSFTGSSLRLLESIIKKPLLQKPDDVVPCPACELLSSKKVIPLLSSRGCPLKCPYCASQLLWPDFRQRDPCALAQEIHRWHRAEGATDFAFYDDALLIHPESHIVPLLEKILAMSLDIRFHVPNGLHVKSITQKIAGLMMRAGFKTLRLGLETADPGLQSATGNKASRDDFTRACRCLKAAGFTDNEVGVYILAGLPGQTAHSVRESIGFVRDHGFRPYLTEYSPIPGTRFWDQAVACSPFPIAQEPLFHNNTLMPCRSDEFTITELEALKRQSRAL